MRPSPSNSPVPRYDDMPSFSVLQTDDERERKAETQRPGTFGVVVTPESFSDLPEYSNTTSPSSRRMSLQSQSSLAAYVGRTSSSLSRTSTQHDPNTVVLDRFEESSAGSGSPFASLPPERRPSLPESMYYLALTTSPPAPVPLPAPAIVPTLSSSPHPSTAGNPLVSRFQQYIVHRLCQPQLSGTPSGVLLPGSTKDMFEIESRRFPPVSEALTRKMM